MDYDGMDGLEDIGPRVTVRQVIMPMRLIFFFC